MTKSVIFEQFSTGIYADSYVTRNTPSQVVREVPGPNSRMSLSREVVTRATPDRTLPVRSEMRHEE